MRIFASMLLLGLASEGWAETDLFGMLACNPIDENKKPVIYPFDGEHLLRDSDASAPFKKVASLSPKLDLYFAFIPRPNRLEDSGLVAERYEDYLSRKDEINVEFYKFKNGTKER